MNKCKNKTNNQKGITLIALVITIVVLVILVGVTVSTAINSGLIANSKKAVGDYEKVQTQEEQIISGLDMELDILQSSKSSGLKSRNGYLTGIKIDYEDLDYETVADLKSRLPDGYDILNKDGTPITATAIYATTGMIVTKNGTEVGRIVVFGNVDTYPSIVNNDSVCIWSMLNRVQEFKDYEVVAMDVNHDGKVNGKDAWMITQYIADETTIQISQDAYINENVKIMYVDDVVKEHLPDDFENNYALEIDTSATNETSRYTIKVGSNVSAGTLLTAIGDGVSKVNVNGGTQGISETTSEEVVTNGSTITLNIEKEGYSETYSQAVVINIVVE